MHPILYLVGAILVVIPFWMILPRAGIASAWALVALIPIAPLILLWVLALKRWPGDEASGRSM